MYRWCRRSNLAAEDAADVVQEVLSAVMIHLPDFRRDRPEDSFGGWLATITRNKIREHSVAGRARLKPEAAARPAADGRNSPAAGTVRRERSGGRSVGCLPVAARVGDDPRGVRGPHLGGFGGSASADNRLPTLHPDLEMSVPAVYKAKCRVLRRFRQVLGELPE